MDNVELSTLIGEKLMSEFDQTITRTLLRNADHNISHVKPLPVCDPGSLWLSDSHIHIYYNGF